MANLHFPVKAKCKQKITLKATETGMETFSVSQDKPGHGVTTLNLTQQTF